MNGAISGTSGIAKFGTSNLVLNAANNYTGPTLLLRAVGVGNSGSIAASPLIQINPGTLLDVSAKPAGLPLAPGQTLNLGGSVLGDLTVGSGSTLLGSGVFAGSLTVTPGAEVAPRQPTSRARSSSPTTLPSPVATSPGKWRPPSTSAMHSSSVAT